MNTVKVRIGNIEIRNLEVIKWRDNEYYNKLDTYLDNGWAETVRGTISKGATAIDIKLFFKEELAFTIARLSVDKENEVSMTSVGERVFELTDLEWLNFKDVCNIGVKLIKENSLK